MTHINIKAYIGTVFVGALFIIVGYYSFTYQDGVANFINSYGAWSMFIYTSIGFFATVIAPVSATPLIPVASATWGPTTAALLSLIGWNAGSVVAYWIARKLGYDWVKRFSSMRKVHKYMTLIPQKNLFTTVVLMRIILPVDVLSYALGLTTNMPIWSYTLASIIGTIPFAFIFAYTATIPIELQAVVLTMLAISLFFTYRHLNRYMRSLKSVDEKDIQNT